MLVKNRESIADKAAKIADKVNADFHFKTTLTGGIGTAIIATLALYDKTSPLFVMAGAATGGVSLSLIGLSFVRASFNENRYTQMSTQAEREALGFEQSAPIKNEKAFVFEEYDENFTAKNKFSLSPLKSSSLVAIAFGVSAAIALALAANNDENMLRKDEEIEEPLNQGSQPALLPGN